MPAAPVHHTDTTDVAWDGGGAEKALELPSDETEAIAVGDVEFAFRDGDADATTKAAWWGPHHTVSAEGKPGDANQKACSAIVGILNGGMSGQGMVPDETRQAVYDHVIAHLKDAGVADADLPTLDAKEAKSRPTPTVIAARATRAADLRTQMERRIPAVHHEFELREVPNGTGGTNLKYTGFASTTTPGDGTGEYEMEDAYGPWVESLTVGAFTKTAAEADVAFLLNHEGMTLARTKPGTLKLSEETDGTKSPVAGVTGLYTEAMLDPQNMYVQAMRSAVERGDLDEMSFAFRVIRQEWNATYDRRWINEVSLDKGDVSLVNYGANPHTGGTVALRQRRLGMPSEREVGMPVERLIVRALSILREGKVYSADNLALLQQALEAMVSADNVDIPAIVRLLEQMDSSIDLARKALSTALTVPNTDGTATDLEPTLEPPGTTGTSTTRSAPAIETLLLPDSTSHARARQAALRRVS